MNTFITVDQAKERMHKLQTYIYLAETFEPATLEEQMVKQYAYLGSLHKVAEQMNEMGYEVEVDDVRQAMQARSKNELQKIVRAGYVKRGKTSRKKKF